MRLKLNLDLCRKLLEIFTEHNGTCTDQDRRNQHEGWADCTRCWLLRTVQDGYVQEDVEFDLFPSIRIPKKDVSVLVSEYVELINKFGVDNSTSRLFFDAHKNNKDFLELAIVARDLKRKIDQSK
jgi:hypothetical protein